MGSFGHMQVLIVHLMSFVSTCDKNLDQHVLRLTGFLSESDHDWIVVAN